jgi:hypothetical protein
VGFDVSRYMIDKLMWEIDRSDEALDSFVEDPAAFVAAWEGAASAPEPPYPLGGSLTGEERDAFEAWDYERLYALGAHPYLLWHFVRAIHGPGGTPVGELSEAFKAVVAPHGYPEFAT